MLKRITAIGVTIAALAACAAAQTVTGSGTTNSVPAFTGSSTLGNSPISASGGNVSIGATTPISSLLIQTNGNSDPFTISSSDNQALLNLNQGNEANIDDLVIGGAGPQFENYDFPFTGLIINSHFGYGAELDFTSDSGDAWGGLMAAPSDSGGNTVLWTDSILAFVANNSSTSAFQFLGTDWETPIMTLDNVNNRVGIGVGTATPGAALEVNGGLKLTANSGGAITFQDGTIQSTAYTGVICGGDYAESMDAVGDPTKYGPGDILVLDPQNPGKVLKSAEEYSTSVAGIYSTRPGTVGRRQLTPKTAAEVPMAMIGVVPTKVTAENGAIQIGDLLVSSSKPGYAMKGTDRARMLGAVLGKAMGGLDSGTGVIEVLVTLQ